MRLTIESLAYGGDAVAHLPDGRAAFVPLACPGDTVEATLVTDKGRYVKAHLDSVIEASQSRVEPQCPYFGECGGCQWQHVDYAAQLSAKTDAVRDALRRIGHITGDLAVQPCEGSEPTYGYRNKVEFQVAHDSKGLRLGFSRAGSDELISVDTCHLLPQRLREAPAKLRGSLRYVLGTDISGLNRVALRVGRNTRDIEVALWTEPGPFPRQIAAKTLRDALGATNVVRVLSKTAPAKRDVVGVEVLHGKGAWSERLGGQRYLVSAPSFFQTNTTVAENLVEHVVEVLEVDGTDRVLDLYAGVGTFTVPLAERAGEVCAVESSKYAIADMQRNLRSAQVDALIEPGDAAIVLKHVGRFDAWLVDPPRTGLSDAVLGILSEHRPRRVMYVSCDPATLSRDAAAIASHGYEIRSIRPFDMFPQTYHVETAALFERP